MNLLKRHIGRRVAAVGVGVGLLVLGLEAPAFAAAPTVGTFTPTSGPAECIVAITGTAFTDSPAGATDVTFDDTSTVADEALPAAAFSIVSATEIWAEVDATLTPGAEYTITVSNNGGSATSAATFTSTTGVGTCSPTIASFTPTCASAGATVTITGTNLLVDVAPDAATATTLTAVNFFDYGAGTLAASTVPNTDTPTTLTRFVPTAAKDGPIKVTTDVASAFSTDSFQVPPPDCPLPGGIARNVTLRLRDALVARGKVSASSATAPAGCTAGVPVKIQRRRAGGGWRTVGKTTTSDTGGYRKKIRNRHGKYRSLAPKLTLASGDVCSRAVSKVVKH
jgi:hypothetical protein